MSTFQITVLVLLVLILIEVCTPSGKRGRFTGAAVLITSLLWVLYQVGIWLIVLAVYLYDTYGTRIGVSVGAMIVGIVGYSAVMLLLKGINHFSGKKTLSQRKYKG